MIFKTVEEAKELLENKVILTRSGNQWLVKEVEFESDALYPWDEDLDDYGEEGEEFIVMNLWGYRIDGNNQPLTYGQELNYAMAEDPLLGDMKAWEEEDAPIAYLDRDEGVGVDNRNTWATDMDIIAVLERPDNGEGNVKVLAAFDFKTYR